ncbi:aminotransferase class IV [Rhodospirillaceae bacterium SYSU D60014]|uniref:aminotransferase class IV n=1 Tax=Virgifigura deserti TaxID=2268457 RepID=UPI000E671C44
MIFLNGALVDPAEARIDPTDRGFLLADGLLATLRAYAGRPFRLPDHLAQLRADAARLGITVPLSDATLSDAVAAVLDANRLDRSDASIRITLTRGPGPRGLLPPERPTPTLMITAARYAPPAPRPRSAGIASIRRNDQSPTAQIKSLAYLDNILALHEVVDRGFDEALLLNTQGRVAGGSHANLFLVIDGALCTPPPSEGVRPGIARGVVLGLGRPVQEKPLEATDLDRAEEAFLTNSLIEIAPLSQIEDRVVGNGEIGPLTTVLLARYQAAVAENRL